MGLTSVKVEISNIYKPSQAQEIELLVDSGATFSMVPRELLERLDILPVEKGEFILAESSFIKREMGYAFFGIGERKRLSPVIFGEKGDKAILGAVTLEILGYELDPITKKLKPTPLHLITYCAV
jgi:clan AA aspartic protease